MSSCKVRLASVPVAPPNNMARCSPFVICVQGRRDPFPVRFIHFCQCCHPLPMRHSLCMGCVRIVYQPLGDQVHDPYLVPLSHGSRCVHRCSGGKSSVAARQVALALRRTKRRRSLLGQNTTSLASHHESRPRARRCLPIQSVDTLRLQDLRPLRAGIPLGKQRTQLLAWS